MGDLDNKWTTGAKKGKYLQLSNLVSVRVIWSFNTEHRCLVADTLKKKYPRNTTNNMSINPLQQILFSVSVCLVVFFLLLLLVGCGVGQCKVQPVDSIHLHLSFRCIKRMTTYLNCISAELPQKRTYYADQSANQKLLLEFSNCDIQMPPSYYSIIVCMLCVTYINCISIVYIDICWTIHSFDVVLSNY